MNDLNPFLLGIDIPDEYFCGREGETALLKKHIANGRNVLLTSPRRLGKSGLIKHFFRQAQIQKNYNTLYVDIYATHSLEDLVYTWSSALQAQIQKNSKWYERFFKTISSLRFAFKLDSNTGEPSFELRVGDIKNPDLTLDQIFEYLESEKKPTIVAFDEFQQVASYEEQGTEALLRSKIQQSKKTRFIFSGSRQHLMNEIFLSQNRPFYQSALPMNLEAIPLDDYCSFAKKLFSKHNRNIAGEVIHNVYKAFNGTTWFVQMVMNELYSLTPQGETCQIKDVEEAFKNIILIQEPQYRDQLASLPPKQKILLQAIATEGCANNITTADFVKKYNLVSASSVQAALKGLLAKQLVTQESGCYRIYDYFFAHWLKTQK